MRKLLPLLLLIGCGDDGGTVGIDASNNIDAPTGSVDAAIDSPGGGGTFTVTSTAYANNTAIPVTHACAARGGQNTSPPLTFMNPPSGTLSYAVVFTDLSNGLVHSAIYDIPLALGGLVADIDKVYAPPDAQGAHQTNNYSNTRGYAGPCPGTPHMYQFKVYALATATVPNATMNTTKDQLVTLLATNLGTATLTGTFTP